MVYPDHEIDSAFRNRFDRHKNTHVDVEANWLKVENALNGGVAASGGQTTVQQTFNVLAQAACVAAMALLPAADAVIKKYELSGLISESSRDAVIPSQTISDSRSTLWSLPTKSVSMAQAPLESKTAMVEGSENQAIEASVVSLEQLRQTEQWRSPDSLSAMPLLALTMPKAEPIILDQKSLEIVGRPGKHAFSVRGMLRIGAGERSSPVKEGVWASNLGFGLAHHWQFAPRLALVSEVGLIRRSGNALERAYESLISQTSTAIAMNSVYSATASIPSFEVRESLVATKLDYVHVPIKLAAQLNSHVEVSMGGYFERLISATNSRYVVYNGTEYVVDNLLEDGSKSTEGLNKYRYGVVASVERAIIAKTSVGISCLLPLNGAVTKQATLPFANASRGFDVQVSLRRRI